MYCFHNKKRTGNPGIDDAETTREILISLGYKRLYPVTKLRQYYHKGMMTACVDQVEGLGSFLELEILVNTLEEKENALAKHRGTSLRYGQQPERNYAEILSGDASFKGILPINNINSYTYKN